MDVVLAVQNVTSKKEVKHHGRGKEEGEHGEGEGPQKKLLGVKRFGVHPAT